jgi:prepilin-type N-terminal cleavage/methylation domain-containing protein
LSHNLRFKTSRGFTLVELMVVMVLVGVLSVAFVTFFSTSITQYLALHQDSLAIGELSIKSQRIAKVLRGSTDIISATSTDLSVYAYFYPNDAYVSQIRYYKSADAKILYADVTPMTQNPPLGTPITAQKQTFTIINNFYNLAGVNTFEYLDSSNATLAMPISDLRTIKGIRINLAEPYSSSISQGSNPMSLVVSLRNRKTNL